MFENTESLRANINELERDTDLLLKENEIIKETLKKLKIEKAEMELNERHLEQQVFILIFRPNQNTLI